MAQNRTRRAEAAQSREQSRLRERSRSGAKVFYDDSILPEEQRPDDEPDIEHNDTYDEDESQDTADVRIDEFIVSGAQPIWLLCSGQILWAGDRTGHSVNEMNQFRRRLQSYLDVLRSEFTVEEASDAELLEALHGFFKKDTPLKLFRLGILKYLEGLRDDSMDASDKALLEVLSSLLKRVYQRRKIDEIKQFRLDVQSSLDVLRSEFTVKDASDEDILKALHGFFKSVYSSQGEDQDADDMNNLHNRLREHLDVLHSKDAVKDISDEELHKVLNGFLKSLSKDDSGDAQKKGSKSKAGWMDHLPGYSIICGENGIKSLREFWTVKGKGKGRSADDPSIAPPDGIMKLWVECYRNSPENRDKAPKDIFTSRKRKDGTSPLDEIYDSIQSLCSRINAVTERFRAQDDDDNGIGLASPLLYVWSKEAGSMNNELTKWNNWCDN